MGILYLVSTPIGNLEDLSIRAIRILRTVGYVCCEDTRRTGQLLSEIEKRFGIYDSRPLRCTPRLIRYDDQKELNTLPEVISLLLDGNDIALVSDAGTPIIADPGFKLVQAAVKRSIPVTSVPGPSAFVTALTLSGLPPSMCTFVGYLPEKQGKRMQLLHEIQQTEKSVASTYIAYCAPHKLIQTLKDMHNTYGDIHLVIARELTKVHEEVFRGTISEAISHFQSPQGELVIVFIPA